MKKLEICETFVKIVVGKGGRGYYDNRLYRPRLGVGGQLYVLFVFTLGTNSTKFKNSKDVGKPQINIAGRSHARRAARSASIQIMEAKPVPPEEVESECWKIRFYEHDFPPYPSLEFFREIIAFKTLRTCRVGEPSLGEVFR